jgi:hypothetical protein
VKRKVLKKSVCTVFLAAGILFVNGSAFADPTHIRDECAKELLLSYFPEPIVLETLNHFNIPKDKWEGIAKSLAVKDKEIVKIVEKKAAAMTPNPLKDTQQRHVAVKLFRDTLSEAFSDALKENGVEDESQFTSMLDEIQQQKAKKFALCMEKQKAQLQKQLPGATGSTGAGEDSEEDDSHSDEDEDDSDEENESEERKKEDEQKKSEEKKLISPQ